MSINKADQWIHGPYLGGFKLGNSEQSAIITTNPAVRLHLCERGLGCEGLSRPNVVYITPIVGHIGHKVYTEDGIDFGDLTSNTEFSLHGQLQMLLDMLGSEVPPDVRKMLIDASKSRKETVPLAFDNENGHKAINIDDLLTMLISAARMTQRKKESIQTNTEVHNRPGTGIKASNGELLPTWVTFPYSRHSSLGELRNFVGTFRPMDIYPCVIDEGTWNENQSVESLYGDLCSGKDFSHDLEMRDILNARLEERNEQDLKLEEMEAESQQRNLATQYPERAISVEGGESQQLEFPEAEGRIKMQKEEAEQKAREAKTTAASPPPRISNTVLSLSKIRTPTRNTTPKEPQSTSSSHESSLQNAALKHPFYQPQLVPCKLDGDESVQTQPFAGASASSSAAELSVEPKPGHNTTITPHKRRKLTPSRPIPALAERLTADEIMDDPDATASEDELTSSNNLLSFRPSPRRRVKRINPQSSAFVKSLVDEVCKYQDMDEERVEEGVRGAMELGGKSWGNVELESTKRHWRYGVEEEL